MKRVAMADGGPHSPIKENQYLVIASLDDKFQCLVCHCIVKNKTHNIKRHYTLKHATEYDGNEGDERKELIKRLKSEIPNAQQEVTGIYYYVLLLTALKKGSLRYH